MSYTVLARKWRPATFAEMAGQEHVRRALANALDDNRLHHAFLFSGTRGVGKTTVARILAKCLNCENGVSSEPCGACDNCREIDEGRFVDLIEVDAASRTKVDDTRELLDNVQYRPTRGTYKVYLIDEVHMLSKHSFNALLKTLEEPPEHVKFLLATTDPQKLPVTVLSRCLQFNLKKLPVDLIVERLQRICKEEGIACEEAALPRLARSAAGSMRDALSLLDQAIAFGGGSITEADVQTMLGTVDRQDVAALLDAVVTGDAALVMERIAAMDEHAPDYEQALIELASLVQRSALAQAVPEALDDSRGDRELALRVAGAASAEELQLYYQIAVIGRRDLHLAADPRGGFEMVLLRMLAFRPASAADRGPAPPAASGARSRPARKRNSPSPARDRDTASGQDRGARSREPDPTPAAQDTVDARWPAVVAALNIRGAARQLAANCTLVRRAGKVWHLMLDERHSHLLTDNLRDRLRKALAAYTGEAADLRIALGAPGDDTPAALDDQAAGQKLDAARSAIAADPNVQALKDAFDAKVHEDSVQPADSDPSGENQDLF